MLTEALAFFGMSDLVKIKRMTLQEYRLRHKAHIKQYLEKETLIHLQAYKNREVKATKDGKKYVFAGFSDFYDVKSRQRELLGSKPRSLNPVLLERMRRSKEFRERRKIDGR